MPLKRFWNFQKHFIYTEKKGASKNKSIVVKKNEQEW